MKNTKLLFFLISILFCAALNNVNAQNLNLYINASSDVAAPGDRITYILTASNTGTVNMTDVLVEVEHPQNIGGFSRRGDGYNSVNDNWTVGTLAPGESRQVVLYANVINNAPQGVVTMDATASANGVSDISKSFDVIIDPTPLLRLSLAPDPGPAEPGKPFTYTISYGNIGSSSPSNVKLTLPIPDGTSFLKATGGGTESGGRVTWNIGTVGVGASGQVRLTVMPDANLADGSVLEAEAELDPGVSNAAILHSSANIPVLENVPLKVQYAVNQTALGQGDRITYILTASNTGTVNMTDVLVEVEHPQNIAGFSRRGDGYNSVNDSWTVGTLTPGESRQVVLYALVGNKATQGDISRSRLIARSSMSEVSAALDIQIDPTPLLRLSLAPDPGPAEPGKPFTYTISYGNIGSSSPSNVKLTMSIPDGTSFLKATGGGTESGGSVTWNIGTVGVGASGQVRLTVMPDANLADGSVLEAEAELDPGVSNAAILHSSANIPVLENVPLKLQYAVNQTALGQGDRITYILTASNTGTVNMTDVLVEVQHPQNIGSFSTRGDGYNYINDNWTVGTLTPGESRQVVLYALVGNKATQGDISRSRLIARSSMSEVSAALDIQIDPTPLLRLSLAPDPGPAEPGKPFTYTISYGNIGSSSPSNVKLTMSIPDGTSFLKATGGGTESGGRVIWNIGTVGVGASGQVRLTVMPDANLADGSVLEAEAELDPGVSNAAILHSSANIPVLENVPLKVQYAVNQTALGQGDRITYILTASNTGTVNMTDVLVEVEHPQNIAGFSRRGDGYNSVNDSWTVGTLTPGESRQVVLYALVGNNAPQGDISRSRLIARSSMSEVSAALDIQIDPTPLLRLSLAPDPGPAEPGKPFTYTISYGNIGSSSSSDVIISMAIPKETHFTDATCGYNLNDDVVYWHVQGLAPGIAGKLFMTIIPDQNLSDGTQIKSLVKLDPGTTNLAVLRSSSVTTIHKNVPLQLTFNSSNKIRTQGESLTYELSATNLGSVNLTDVVVELQHPNFISSFNPVGDGYNSISDIWTIGSLAPNQTNNLSLSANLNSNTTNGEILISHIIANATGSNQLSLQENVLSGSLINLPPDSTSIIRPEDGSSYNIGGINAGDPPVPYDSLLIIEWNPSMCDPENDSIKYIWQLSTSEDYSNLLMDTLSNENGSATYFEVEFGTLENLLANNDVEIGDSLMLYHRVVTSDGYNNNPSESFSIILIRGTVVGTEETDSNLPDSYALYNNYPNPFNPTTKIEYSIPKTSNVELKVFDILGREVADLVNEEKPAGNYTVNFNASKLSSGIYFYRIKSNEFIQTKKMILLR